ncbi:aldo/keto reductase [Pyrofollis japonicus]|uniref:aldo/keto reductase n=1 Tax=Pyrofollis japonicus TaxID=3060460 RepID=UPI00295BDB88|nr:aldo/keto reductase [Pyrofollis japonicus]BEP17498.1 aldo/keto reductase [Pyrofollis japonicus]
MDYRFLGRTGLRVSRIGFGVYSLTGLYGSVPEEDAIELLRYAERLGINFFDTADVYANGYGEELLCRAFGERGMARIVVATKIGYDFYSRRTPPPRRYDETYLLWASEKSSERLCKKPIDLIQIHNPSLHVLRDMSFWKTVERLTEEGFAKHVGVALGPETDVLEHAIILLQHGRVESIQFVYNILEQEPGATIARMAASRGVGTIARVPHGGGVLDESITLAEARNLSDHRSLRRNGWYEWAFKVYSEVKNVLENAPGTPGQKALRFVIDSAPIDAVIVVAKNKDRLKEYIEALELPPLVNDIIRTLREIYTKYVEESPEKPAKSLSIMRTWASVFEQIGY